MKRMLGAIFGCGLGLLVVGCGSSNGGRLDAGATEAGAGVAVDAGIMPPPVLDPKRDLRRQDLRGVGWRVGKVDL